MNIELEHYHKSNIQKKWNIDTKCQHEDEYQRYTTMWSDVSVHEISS